MKYNDGFDESEDYKYSDEDYAPSISIRNKRVPLENEFPSRKSFRSSVSRALLAGAFMFGIGTGVTVDSAINTNPRDLASRDAIDRSAPNPNICQKYGMSAIALDSRLFMSFNPFSVYVAQGDVKPACVLRSSNWNVLEREGLITAEEANFCKNSMNTWAFVGNLEDKPQISCVYQSDDAQNEFLSDPKLGIGEDIYDEEMEANKYLKNPINRMLNSL